ncbi:MAG: hypothetical protein H7Y38_19140 [Armatimonadetes bacterium]|nr:hypothetical protein [Armatimonadota bacterium]
MTEPLILALSGEGIESAWNGIIDDWTYASDDEVMTERQFIGTVRDRVIEGLEDTGDAVEFQTSALLAFTRLKAFWFELSSRLGYHLDPQTGDASLPLRAGLVAALLAAMEPHLPKLAVKKVNSFLSAVVSDDVENDILIGNRILPGPAEVRVKIAGMFNTIQSLSQCVVRQEAELIELKAGQDALQKTFGETTTAPEIAARMNTLSAQVIYLEAQTGMEDVYRNVLSQALGTADPLTVVKEVRHLREEAKRLENEMFQLRRENDRVSEQFGEELSPDDALGRLRDAEQAVVAVLEENDALQIRLAAQAQRTETVTQERDRLLQILDAPGIAEAEAALSALHENAAAYHDIASLLGDVGKQLGKIGG